jgi:sec-independent protein translocase protein TatA
MFGNLGFTEIAILVLILVLFFGAKRIPEIGASIGKGIKEFKRGLKDREVEPPEPPPPVNPPVALPPAGSAPKRLTR